MDDSTEKKQEGDWFDEGDALKDKEPDPAEAARTVAGLLSAHRRDFKRGRIILWGNSILAVGIVVSIAIRGKFDGIAAIGVATTIFAAMLSYRMRRKLHSFAGGIQELEALHGRLLEKAAQQKSDDTPNGSSSG